MIIGVLWRSKSAIARLGASFPGYQRVCYHRDLLTFPQTSQLATASILPGEICWVGQGFHPPNASQRWPVVVGSNILSFIQVRIVSTFFTAPFRRAVGNRLYVWRTI